MVRRFFCPLAGSDTRGEYLKAIIITPAYCGTVHELDEVIRASGLPWLVLHEHSDLPRARSVLFTHALEKFQAEVIVAVDADNVPTVQQLETVIGHAADGHAAFGCYIQRDGKRLSVQPLDSAAGERCLASGDSFELEFAGLGFAAFHKSSLESASAHMERVRELGAEPWLPFCVPLLLPGGLYLADDRSLCHRLRESGTRLLCYPELRVKHSIRQLV